MQIKIFCLALCVFNIYCKDLLYVGAILPTSFYKCFKQTGYDSIILPLDTYFQGELPDNIIKAKNAGLKVHVAYPVCRNKPFQQLAQQLIKLFGNNTLQNLWLFGSFEDTDPFCPWEIYPVESNCQFAKQFLYGLKKYNINANVMINQELWVKIFGSAFACPELSNFLSWWFPEEQQQNLEPNFDGYQQIGGWKKPFMKIYSNTRICGYPEAYINYYE